MASVAKFITTFNRPDRLREVIEVTLGQTRRPDLVLIVDNGDPEPIRKIADAYGVEHHSTGANLGPAGAAAPPPVRPRGRAPVPVSSSSAKGSSGFGMPINELSNVARICCAR